MPLHNIYEIKEPEKIVVKCSVRTYRMGIFEQMNGIRWKTQMKLSYNREWIRLRTVLWIDVYQCLCKCDEIGWN